VATGTAGPVQKAIKLPPQPDSCYPESLRSRLIHREVTSVTGTSMGDRVTRALAAAKMSQRTLAATTKISQPTLSRIISGERAAKMPDLVAIA
jgi:ribosome-binding protein aMBF1 (putative translation factor)